MKDEMGLVRTILAIAVVFAHTYGFLLVGGQLAVQLFYMISGFLISFVLIDAQSYNSTIKFYVNRILRLVPLYWFIAFLSLLLVVGSAALGLKHPVSQTFEVLNWDAKLALIVTNIVLLGQDWIMFMGVVDDQRTFISDFRDSDVPLYKGLLVPQAWTLGVELSFYLIAPFILKRTAWIILLFVASVLVRAFLFREGLAFQDPWSYRFFRQSLHSF